ncbi:MULTISPECIES: hypothetical protein [unclassified Mesorhizobium]|uniref:hypothetical protein n=1 Tax=unclassified Mesorhizobium TaxID=325217 RepID=UPI001FD9D90A|nr:MULTISPECIES: hypothetical protein [unclassified Mesorhizobium]WJI60152.1 hypothetical protein NLY33_23070 [Mesorhizobium sp. C432A]
MSAIAFRFDTPVPNWRSVMLDCAQMVGKPLMAPEPAARPTAAAPVLSNERREIPVFVSTVFVIPIPLFCFANS